MFTFIPPGGDMPDSGTNSQRTKEMSPLQKLLMEKIKQRMEESAEDNDIFDHVPRAGDDTGA